MRKLIFTTAITLILSSTAQAGGVITDGKCKTYYQPGCGYDTDHNETLYDDDTWEVFIFLWYWFYSHQPQATDDGNQSESCDSNQ